MDGYDFIMALGGLVVAMLGFWLNKMDSRVSKIETDLPNNYVLKTEYRDDISEIKSTLKDIFKILREHEKNRIAD